MRVLALDLSTHAGFALFVGEQGQKPELVDSGTSHLDRTVHHFGPYPVCYYYAAEQHATDLCCNLKFKEGDHLVYPDLVVIEETNLGRNRYVQKLLEFLHCHVVGWYIQNQVPVVYLDSSEWRRNLGLQLSVDQKRQNAKLSRAKRKARDGGQKLDKKSLGIKGKVTWKHLAVAKANEAFGLQLKQKDNDQADALCIGLAWFNKANPCDGV